MKADDTLGYYPSYLTKLVARKKIEVDTFLRQHQDINDPIVMRMGYVASECYFNVTKAIKIDPVGKESMIKENLLKTAI